MCLCVCCIEDIKESLSVYNCVYIAHVMYIMICDDGSLRDGLLLCNSMLVAAVVMVVVVGIHLALGSVFDDFFFVLWMLSSANEWEWFRRLYRYIYARRGTMDISRFTSAWNYFLFLFYFGVRFPHFGMGHRLEAHPYTIHEECDTPHRQL